MTISMWPEYTQKILLLSFLFKRKFNIEILFSKEFCTEILFVLLP